MGVEGTTGCDGTREKQGAVFEIPGMWLIFLALFCFCLFVGLFANGEEKNNF